MTIKEASDKFNIDEKEIRKRKNDNMILGVSKKGNKIVIPDDVSIIPSKKDIQSFLLQILKFKNNPQITISRELCPTKNHLEALIEYLYNRGFIGEYTFSEKVSQLFTSIQLTENGFNYIIGSCSYNKISEHTLRPIQLNPSINISAIKIG